jgi:hypothetical protein
MKIFIYNIEYDDRKVLSFEECTETENFINLYLRNKHTIVNDINKADVAFIPVWNASLRYTHPSLHRTLWVESVIPQLHLNSNIPHFTTWCYVLYNENIDFIPSYIKVWAYEAEVTLPDQTIRIDNGCFDRMIIIPYNLKQQSHSACRMVKETHLDSTLFSINNWKKCKDIKLSFVGSIEDKVSEIREMRSNIVKDITKSIFDPQKIDPTDVYRKSQFALILRGDTPTRKAFYQAISCACFPIICEDSLIEYLDLFRGKFAHIIQQIIITVPKFVTKKDIKYFPNRKQEFIDKNSLNIQMEEKLLNLENLLPIMYFLTFHVFDYNKGCAIEHALNATFDMSRPPMKLNIPIVFNYILPENLNKNCLPVNISSKEKVNINNALKGMSQYGLEVILHHKFDNYPYITSCIQRANVAFLPCYPFLGAWTKNPYIYNVEDSVQIIKETLKLIPKWSEDNNQNIPHIIPFGDVLWDDDRVFWTHLKLPFNTVIVSLEQADTCPYRNITVPFPCEKVVQVATFSKSRKFLFGYIGRSNRQLVSEMMNNFQCIVKILDIPGWHSSNEDTENIIDLYKNCTFSWQPHGDRQTRRGFYHSILYDCIPVVTNNNSDHYKNLFCDTIDILEACVVVDSNDTLENIMEKLYKVNKEKKLHHIRKIKNYLQYDKEAFETLLKLFL